MWHFPMAPVAHRGNLRENIPSTGCLPFPVLSVPLLYFLYQDLLLEDPNKDNDPGKKFSKRQLPLPGSICHPFSHRARDLQVGPSGPKAVHSLPLDSKSGGGIGIQVTSCSVFYLVSDSSHSGRSPACPTARSLRKVPGIKRETYKYLDLGP